MGSAFDSVGTLLADMANLLGEGLRILGHSDKRHWGQDEHEQVHALEQALDEAKKDYQELCPLVNGQAQYRHDRNRKLPQTTKSQTILPRRHTARGTGIGEGEGGGRKGRGGGGCFHSHARALLRAPFL